MTLIRLYFRLVSIQIRSQMQYRFSFWMDIFSTALLSGSYFIALVLVMQQFKTIAGWSLGARGGAIHAAQGDDSALERERNISVAGIPAVDKLDGVPAGRGVDGLLNRGETAALGIDRENGRFRRDHPAYRTRQKHTHYQSAIARSHVFSSYSLERPSAEAGARHRCESRRCRVLPLPIYVP